LLEGKTVNLRVWERDDIDFLVECLNDIDFRGEYIPIDEQYSKSEWMKYFDNSSKLAILTERKDFIIQKKDGIKIGLIGHWFNQPYRMMEIVYSLIPNERAKGYGTEAVELVVDYLFLSKDLARIQAIADVRNKASQRVLEKAGFQREGTIRKSLFNRGELRDYYLYSILREEWKEPRILTRTEKE
jgi:RimJ/RimL family protein N-acetyltransferase